MSEAANREIEMPTLRCLSTDFSVGSVKGLHGTQVKSPVGHVFRAGHQLSLSISQPPVNDPVPIAKGKRGYKSGSYKYESNQPPSTVTIQRGTKYASSILLPLLPSLPPISESLPDSIDKLWRQPKSEDVPAAGFHEPQDGGDPS